MGAVIIDYSDARPPVAALRAAGVTAAGRYIGWDGQPGFASTGKNITVTEAASLHAAGISVFLSFEYAANAADGGTAQGARDGKLAAAQMTALGAPPLTAVYFAVDFDLPDYAPSLPGTAANAKAKLGPVAAYFTAINEQQPSYRTGVYGGFWAVQRVLDAGLASLAWQTVAWSGGQRDARAVLYQTTQAVSISGADYDVHEGTSPDFGQWAPSPPPAHPVLSEGATGAAVVLMQQKLDNRGAHLTADGNFGPLTLAALKAFQVTAHLTADGVCGPLTWAALGV